MKKQFVYTTIFICIILLSNGTTPFAQTRAFPQAPVLLSPPNEALIRFPGTQIPIPFSWEAVEGADSYQILISVDNRDVGSFVSQETSAAINLKLSILESQSTVRWSVRALRGNEKGNYSDIYSFKFGFVGTPIPGGPVLPTPLPVSTPTPLPPPRLLSPEDQAFLEGFSVAFDWENVTGAASYRFSLFQDNEPFIQKNITDSEHRETIFWPNQEVFQWNVRAIGSGGRLGYTGRRFSFTLGAGILPTPTAVPWDPDINRDGLLDAVDVYWFAQTFGTNASLPDFDRSGITNQRDLLHFLEAYRALHR